MKLQQTTQDLEISGDEETSTFSIAMNGKAFRVLSDTLYQNKIGSIVREISCNAYDAHVAAGKPDVPFEIHLPDAFEPWFSVKDYGLGLTRNAIKTVFTQYFNSTKEDNNDAIGAFGLGAKTPFSYTDQFTVTSIVDGEKTIWTAYIGKSGVPDISVMYAETSDEPTGVEIKMSVKREDFSTFRSEVSGQLQFFKVKPAFTNGTADFATFTCIDETPDYRMYSFGSGVTIVQGNVGYPMIIKNLQGKISNDLYEFLGKLAQKKIDLLFSIGEIGVTASREGVEYNQTTVKNIEAKLEVVLDQLKKGTQAEIDALNTEWEKAIHLQAKSSLHQSMFPSVRLFYQTQELTFNTTTRMTVGWFERRWRYPKKLKSHLPSVIHADKNAVVIFKDVSTLLTRKLNYILDTQPNVHSIYVYSSEQNSASDLSRVLGGVTVIKASEIILPKTLRTKTGTMGPRKRYFEVEDGVWEPRFENLSEIDEQTAYTVVDRLADTESIPYNYKVLSELQAVIPLVMVRESDLEFIENSSLFVPVEKYTESQKSRYNARMCRPLHIKRTIDTAKSVVAPQVYAKMITIVSMLPEDHAVSVYFKKIFDYNLIGITQKVDTAMKIAGLLDLEFEGLVNKRVVKVVNNRYAALEEQFPVLQWMKDWGFRERTPNSQLVKAFVAFSKL